MEIDEALQKRQVSSQMFIDEQDLAQELALDRINVQALSSIAADDTNQKKCLNHGRFLEIWIRHSESCIVQK